MGLKTEGRRAQEAECVSLQSVGATRRQQAMDGQCWRGDKRKSEIDRANEVLTHLDPELWFGPLGVSDRCHRHPVSATEANLSREIAGEDVAFLADLENVVVQRSERRLLLLVSGPQRGELPLEQRPQLLLAKEAIDKLGEGSHAAKTRASRRKQTARRPKHKATCNR